MGKSHTFFFGLLVLVFAIDTSASPILTPNYFITWEGICWDCIDGPGGNAGSGLDNGNRSTATATLGVLALGNGANGHTDLSGGNLLTFSYESAHLSLQSVHVNDAGLTFGLISSQPNSFAVGPSTVQVVFRVGWTDNDIYSFHSNPYGGWDINHSTNGPNDFGVEGRFNVPEPATVALMSLGLIGLGWSRSKKG